MNTEKLRRHIQEISALIHIENELKEEGGSMASAKKRLARQELLEKIREARAGISALEEENTP